MPCSLQEMASRWCHRYVCLVLTIEFYGSTYPVKLRLTLSSLLIHFCIKVSISVTKCIIFFKIRSFSTLKSCPNYTHFAKVGSKFCQTLNKPSTIWQRFIKFCRSGEISPILVTLVSIRKSTPLHLSLILACFWQYVLIFGEAINFSFGTQEEEKEKEGRCNEENDWKTFVYSIPFRGDQKQLHTEELFSRRRWVTGSAPTVKHVWKVDMHVQHNFERFRSINNNIFRRLVIFLGHKLSDFKIIFVLGVYHKHKQLTAWADTAFISFD